MSNSENWRQVRQQRSTPPGLAADQDDRRDVFQAALAQAEELWDAAVASGPASRPLPLFYCLSQAARAVCAAWTTTDSWRPQAHGLKRRASEAATPRERVFSWAASVNAPETGAFSMVARATDSVAFTGDASVADLWVSLPAFPTPSEHLGDRPRCIMLEPATVPGDARPIFQQVVGRTHVAFRFTPPPIDRLPAIYPELGGIVQDGSRQNAFGGEEPLFRFEREDGTVRPVHEIGTLMPNAQSSFGDRIVRPKVGDEAVGPPTEYLTLYTLLFCLSELARYFPDTWVRALDPDESTAAVTLETGLEVALERAPQLIAVALQGPRQRIIEAVVRRLRGEAAVVEEAGQGGEEEADA